MTPASTHGFRRLVGGLVLLAGIGCAESSATADATPDGWSTSTADPQLVRRAESVLADAPETRDGWSTGVVLAEDGDDIDVLWAILTDRGVTVLEPAWSCDGDSDHVDEDGMYLAVDPGDLVTWSAAGDDNLVCSGELDIVRKAAA